MPGQKKWCDGELYCGWGQTTCKADGKWDDSCIELADGRRPATACACYFFIFNEKCCETPDCIVPAGTSGQLCQYSGGKLCDACNPDQPSCAAGAKCVVLDEQAFCGQACGASAPCPTGYNCTKSQCVPAKLTCL